MTAAPLPPADAKESDRRPAVARTRAATPPWIFAGVAILAAGALFLVLDGQRRARSAPSTALQDGERIATVTALPPLVLPLEPPPPPVLAPPAETPTPATSATPPQMPFAPAPVYAPPPQPQSGPPVFSPPPVYTPPQPAVQAGPPASTGSVLVIDTGTRMSRPDERGPGPVENGGSAPATTSSGPIRSGRVQRPSRTIAQGALIPAVLETALDSTRPGFARAVVSREIRSFDGSQVLIPRGSRLVGEYRSELSAGQNRAMIQWTRLVRPDGVTIALESPAADLRGRAGVEGRVDSRFLQRFAGALLQTTLNIGASVAARELGGDSGVIIALPGSTQNTAAAAQPDLQPVLRVDAGARVAVFVARDLELPAAGGR